jgi:Flp pilus assembly pilin Flp
MKNKLKEFLKEQTGQAFAEYAVLFPGVFMVALSAAWNITPGLTARYCEVVNVFSNGICEYTEVASPPGGGDEEPPQGGDPTSVPTETSLPTATETSEPSQPTDTPEPTATDAPTATPTGEECVVLIMDGGCSQCEHHENCTCLPGVNSGFYTGYDVIDSLVIKAGQEYHIYYSGYTDDGCYRVIINEDVAIWRKVGRGSWCKDISHLQSWYQPICTVEED